MQIEFKKYERTLQMIRDKCIPKNPINCAEIIAAFRETKIMSTLGRSKLPGNSVFFDGLIEKATHAFCIFSSKFAIALIQKNIEVARRNYMVDGTFAVCPIGPFNQLLVIHAAYIKCVSVYIMRFIFIYSVKTRKFLFYFSQ